MEQNELVGVWQLQSYRLTSPSGEISTWGKNAYGILIYTAEGYMSAALNRDVEEDTNPFRQVVRSILFYAGTYHLEKNQVTHHVQNASFRSRIGNKEVRNIFWDGRIMTLSADGDSGRADISWKKISS